LRWSTTIVAHHATRSTAVISSAVITIGSPTWKRAPHQSPKNRLRSLPESWHRRRSHPQQSRSPPTRRPRSGFASRSRRHRLHTGCRQAARGLHLQRTESGRRKFRRIQPHGCDLH
jgi:hypothetical protein